MAEAAPGRAAVVGFGVFELDLRSGELRRNGVKLKLEGHPLQILMMLLECPGQVVTREELRGRLWPADTYVDFEHSINAAVNRLRQVLDDSADTPRFISTIPRRGYRFIYPVSNGIAAAPPAGPHRGQRRTLAVISFVLVVSVAIILVADVGRVRRRIVARSWHPQMGSVAVLPFENLTGDASQEYFADGMTDELTTELAQIRSLRVISRTSAMQYKGNRKAVADIARDLKVDALIEGSVVRSGGRVRVTAQLIDASTDQHLWAQSYERDLRDIVSLQSEIARAIIAEIQAKLTPEERARLASVRPVDPEAYQLYLMGRFHLSQRTEDSMSKAVGFLQQAIAKDPGYAPAYASLAEAYDSYDSGTFRTRSPRELLALARAAAQKALELDPNLPDAYTVLASTSAEADWDLTAAERYFRKALSVGPGNATAHYWYARLLAGRNRTNEAIAEIERARELDPLSLVINDNAGEIYLAAGDFEKGLAQLQKTLEMDPNYPRTHINLGEAYEGQGKNDAAVAEYQKARALGGENWSELREPLQRAYEKGGMHGYYQAQFRLLVQMSQTRYVSPVYLATIAGVVGDKEQALAWLEKAFQERDPGLLPLKDGDSNALLRSDPRYQDLLRRIRAAIK